MMQEKTEQNWTQADSALRKLLTSGPFGALKGRMWPKRPPG